MIYYIGGFPPPYGGVTVKNRDLYEAISGYKQLTKIDLNRIKKGNINDTLLFLKAILKRDSVFIIGVAAHSRRKLCKLLYYVNKHALTKSILFLMGGMAAKDIARDKMYQKYIRPYKRVYAETRSMQRMLLTCGLTNAKLYPNCRFKPSEFVPNFNTTSHRIRPVYFSLIQPQKGADIVLETAEKMPETTFVFYGPIDDKYKKKFYEKIKSLNNVQYKGVFSGAGDDVYNELAKYDVLVFPTKWNTEGVPGILVESKIAGITCIVSNNSYNAEIIKDGYEGIVLKSNTSNQLACCLNDLNRDRKKLDRLKRGNYESAKGYYIENYTRQIVSVLNN